LNLWRRPLVDRERLVRLAKEGAAIREMMQHPASLLIENRIGAELDWVRQEWNGLLESGDTSKTLEDRRYELYAYLKALEVMKAIFLDLPKQGWIAEDKLLAFASRTDAYNSKGASN